MSRAMAGIDVGKGQLDVSVDEGQVRVLQHRCWGGQLWSGLSGVG